MIGDRRSQSVDNGSIAVQSQRDTNIYTGASPTQMLEVFEAISKQVEAFSQEATKKVEERLSLFKKETIDQILKTPNARPEAFSDPDFQNVLYSAQTSYACSDDIGLHESLVNLIVERTKHVGRSRLSLSINDAIIKAGKLTIEEFSALALIFYIQHVQIVNIPSINNLATAIESALSSLILNVPDEPMSFSYMESVGCLKTGSSIVVKADFFEMLRLRYPWIVTRGAPRSELSNLLPGGALDSFICEAPLGDDGSIFLFGEPEFLRRFLIENKFDENVADKYVDICKNYAPNRDRFAEAMRGYGATSIYECIKKYDGTSARNASLTSAGIALGHAYLMKNTNLNADISIWIK